MKKIGLVAKIFLGMIILVVVCLMMIPFFEKDIIDFIKHKVNEQINATVDFKSINFESLDISTLKVALGFDEVSVINKAPFEGDTLFYAESVLIKASFSAFFSKESQKTYDIPHVSVNNAKARILIGKDSIANYDIVIPSTKKEEEEIVEIDEEIPSTDTSPSPKFVLQHYDLKNIDIIYWDKTTDLKVHLDNFYHEGSGDFTTHKFDLKTSTKTKISLSMGDTSYLKNNFMALDATFGVDLNEQKYSFLENKFTLNRLKLNFDGYVKLLEQGTEIKLKFNSPSTGFLSFLEMLPEKYTKSLKGIHTDGRFTMEGYADGILNNTHIPRFSVSVIAEKGMFKYPDLPKSVTDIYVNAKMINSTGIPDDTFISIPVFNFDIDKDHFESNIHISNLIKNPFTKGTLKGSINLKNLSEAYPVSFEQQLSGLLNLNVKAAFDMESIEKKQYDAIDIVGNIAISDFKYESNELPSPVFVEALSIGFAPNHIKLDKLIATTGKSDFHIVGSMDNLLGFLLKDQILSADFQLYSDQVVFSDIITDTEDTDVDKTTSTPSDNTPERFKIPAFLNCKFRSKIDKVIYDNLTLTNMTGYIILKDQKAVLEGLNFKTLGGKLSLSGTVDTKPDNIAFDTKMTIKKLDIKRAFTTFNTLKTIAPIGDAIGGKFNANTAFKGVLKNDFTVSTDNLEGEMDLAFINGRFYPEKSPMLKRIDKNISFVNLKNMKVDDIKVNMLVLDKKVVIKPFRLVSQRGITADIGGTHGFDQSVDYKISAQIPVRDLGGDVKNIISGIDDDELKNIKVPVVIGISGSFNKPKIHLDLKPAMQEAKKQIKNHAKKAIKKKGAELLNDFLGRVIPNDTSSGKKSKNNSKEDIKETANKLLKGLLGK